MNTNVKLHCPKNAMFFIKTQSHLLVVTTMSMPNSATTTKCASFGETMEIQ